MATYNGHKNWNHWNVSLWINNDQGLYIMATELAKLYKRDTAARVMLSNLQQEGWFKTPDGAPYSVTTIKAAMVGL